jgi:hypothetical protein
MQMLNHCICVTKLKILKFSSQILSPFPEQSSLVLAKSFEKMPFSEIIFGDYYVAFRGLLLYLDSFRGLLLYLDSFRGLLRCFLGIITVPG